MSRNLILVLSTAETMSVTKYDIVAPKCPKCGANANGKPSCCGGDGAWAGKCGDEIERKEHTWTEGIKACLRKS